MKLFAYTLVSLFAVLNIAQADESKSSAPKDEVVLEQAETTVEEIPAEEAKK